MESCARVALTHGKMKSRCLGTAQMDPEGREPCSLGFLVTNRVWGRYLRPVAFTRIIQVLVPQYRVKPGAGLELVNIA